MPDYETPTERYRHLAEGCLHVANDFPRGEHRDALLQMAQVWQRLADQMSTRVSLASTLIANASPLAILNSTT